jgi:hypothetical protein
MTYDLVRIVGSQGLWQFGRANACGKDFASDWYKTALDAEPSSYCGFDSPELDGL